MAGFLDQKITDRYAIYNGDSMDLMRSMPDASIHASIYSPPFSGLYHYSSSDRDVSNARNFDEFKAHYGMFIDEIFRLTPKGRLTAVHAAPIPLSNTGKDSMYDFPGEVIRMHMERGWEWVSRHYIWKEPLAVRNRTMTKNLSHRTICDDAAYGGSASADELLIFRKPGGSDIPIQHPTGLHDYMGAETVPVELGKYRYWEGDQKVNRYSHWIWRRYASSVWDDIRLSNVLPFRDARDPDDEKHVHPLQLDVIARFVQLRTMEGEKVFTPFMGVGSEVFEAVRQGRIGIGCELKPSYYRQAVLNMDQVDTLAPSSTDDALIDYDMVSESSVS